MIQVGAGVRIESGPARKTAIATHDLLDNRVTARHYRIGAKDAKGKVINLGQSMDYLDYRSAPVWYVYQEFEGRYVERGVYETKAAAEKAAHKLLTWKERIFGG